MAFTFTLSPESVKNIQAVNKVGLDKFNRGWVKFGNDKLNINTTSAIGLEKAIGVVAAAKGYTTVMENAGIVLWSANGNDEITGAVIKQMTSKK